MVMKIVLSVVLVAALVCFAGPLAQTAPLQQRITQPIVMNGQQVHGVTVIQDAAIVSYSCTSPQPYVAVDQSSSGWACFDQATGTWLMHAQSQPTATGARRGNPALASLIAALVSLGLLTDSTSS